MINNMYCFRENVMCREGGSGNVPGHHSAGPVNILNRYIFTNQKAPNLGSKMMMIER